MMQSFIIPPPPSSDLYVFNVGSQRCPKNHSHGPAVRRNVLVHYIYEGKGLFESAGKKYNLSAGQAFVIFPQQTTFYKADGGEPWHYRWIEIAGEGAPKVFSQLGISIDNPIIKDHTPFYMGHVLAKIENAASGSASAYNICSYLWDFVYRISECRGVAETIMSGKELYVERAIEYIDANYWRSPSVLDIAEYLGIDRGYLSKLFKEYRGVSPQKYIIEYRMGIAKELLMRDNLTVGDVGRSVGFEDQLAFSKAFKKVTGMSPSLWRSQNLISR